MFKSYNEKSCLFECQLKFAANESGCIPWDYPLPQGLENTEVCKSDFLRNGTAVNALFDFELAMDSNASLALCECPPNCEETVFKMQVV